MRRQGNVRLSSRKILNNSTKRARFGALKSAVACSIERLEERRLLSAVVATPQSAILGYAGGPLDPKPGQSFYESGLDSTGSPIGGGQWANASAITPNISNDLVLNVSPFSSNYHACCEGTGDSANLLTNGITQTELSPGNGNTPSTGDGGSNDPSNAQNVISEVASQYFFAYNLDTANGHVPNSTGYNLSEIDVISGHQDGRVAISSVDVLVEPLGSTHFISLSDGKGFSLTTVPNGSGTYAIAKGSAQMAIVNSGGGDIADNIQAVELSVLNPQTFFREFVVTGTPSIATAPAATTSPTNANVTFSAATGNTISWTPGSGTNTGYTIQRAASASGPFSDLGSVVDQASFVDAGVAPNTAYFYRIIASGNGDSSPAIASITTPNYGPPAVVVAPDTVTFGDTITGPIAAKPGHSFYASGLNFQGAAISQWANNSAITPNTVNDLVLNVTPFAQSYTAASEGSNSPPGNTSSINSARLMTNGLTQNQIGLFPSSGQIPATGSGNISDSSSGANVLSNNAAAAAGWWLEYNLGNYANYNGTSFVTTGGPMNPNGYDISEIDVITGHQDTRIQMQLDIMVEGVGSNQWLSLSNGQNFVLNKVPNGTGGTVTLNKGSAQMAIVSSTPGQLIEQNIQAIKFVASNNQTWFRELVVTGTASASLPPSTPAPTNVTATLTPSPFITWNAVSGAIGYTIQRANDPTNGPWTTIASLMNGTTFTDGTAFGNQTYYYRVIATGVGDSAPSAPSNSVTTPNAGAMTYFFQNQAWQGNIATATASLTSDQVSSVGVNLGGSGYFEIPNVQLIGGGGSGATATAVISGGRVTAINVTSPGSGYTSAPTVVIDSPAVGELLQQVNSTGSGTQTTFPIPANLVASGFSTFIEGKVITDAAGTYLFGANTDDDGYLYVNGLLASSNTGGHGARLATVVNPISLAAHTSYDFVFLQDQRPNSTPSTNAWTFQMYWQEPSAGGGTGPIATVPGTNLVPTADIAPAVGAVTATALSDSAVQLNWAPTGDATSYAYVLQRALADGSGNPISPFVQVAQPVSFSGPTTLGNAGAPNWGITSAIDTTTAPNTRYVYEVGILMPGQSTPTNFSQPSTAVTTLSPATATLDPVTHTINVTLGAYDAVYVFVSPTSQNVVVNEGGGNVFNFDTSQFQLNFFDPTSVTNLNVVGTSGAPAQFTFTFADPAYTLNFAGSVNVNQISDCSFDASALSAGSIQVNTTNSITTRANGPITSSGSVDLRSNGNITVGGNITAQGPVTLNADNDGNLVGGLSISNTATINSNNNNISTHFASLSVAGTVNAGTGNVTYTGTGNSWSASGDAANTITSGTVTLTSGAAGPSLAADSWGQLLSGATVSYNFPAATNSFAIAGVSIAAANTNLQITTPNVITVTGALSIPGSITFSTKNVNIGAASPGFTVTDPTISDGTRTITLPANDVLTLINPAGGPVTLNANVIVSSGARLEVKGGLMLNGTITLNGGTLGFDGTQTLNGNGTILLGSGTNNIFVNAGGSASAGIATITPSISILSLSSAVTGTTNIGRSTSGAFVDSLADQIINQGIINVSAVNQTIVIDSSAAVLVNQGTVESTGGQLTMDMRFTNEHLTNSYLAIGPTARLTVTTIAGVTSYTIDSPLSASSGATLTLIGPWSDTSTISGNNSTINLGGTFSTPGTAANPGTITAPGGTVNISGTMLNTGNTFTLSSGTGTWNILGASSGTGVTAISGGTVTSSDGTPLNLTGNSQIGAVTFGTDLNINGGTLLLGSNSLTLSNANVNLNSSATRASELVAFGSGQLLGIGEIIFSGPIAGVLGNGNSGATTLTIGSGVTVTTGTGNGIIGSGVAAAQIVNNGTITAPSSQTITLLDALTGNSPTGSQGVAWTGADTLNSSDWNDPLNWSGNFVPGPTNSVVINNASTTVVIGSGETQTIQSLVTNSPITISGTLNLSTAQFSSNLSLQGGTLNGGTYAASGGASLLVTANSTVNDVQLSTVTVLPGATLNVTDGGGLTNGLVLTGTMTLNGTGKVSINGIQTLAGSGRVSFAGTGGGELDADGGGALIIGSGITIAPASGASGTDTIGTNGDTIINLGTINPNVHGQITALGGSFTNQANIVVANGELDSTNLTNSGTMTLSAAILNGGGTLTNSASGNITGNGSITTSAGLINNGTITFTGATTSVFGPVTNNSGSLNPADTTGLYIKNILATFFGFVQDGTIAGQGKIKTTGATASYKGGASVVGYYISDPSTNSFTDLTIAPGGVLQGGFDPTTNTSDLFTVSSSLTNNNATAPATSAAQLELQGNAVVTGGFSFNTVTVDPGVSVTITPTPVTGSTFTTTNLVNNGSLDLQTTFTAAAVVNNTGASLAVNAPLTVTTSLSNADNAAVVVNAPVTATSANVSNDGGSVTVNATVTAASVTNTGGGDVTVNAPLTATTVSNSDGGSVTVNAPLTAATLTNGGGSALAINTTDVSITQPVQNDGDLQVNAPVNVPVTSTSQGATTFGTTTAVAAESGTVLDSSFPISATVTAANGVTVNTGIVTFTILDSNNLQVGSVVTASVSNGIASGSFPSHLAFGSYTISATYHDSAAGSVLNDSAGSNTLSVANTIATSTTVSAASGTYGSSVTLSAQVSASNTTVNEGIVTFTIFDQSNHQIGSVTGPVSGNSASASFSLVNVNVGAYTVNATYHDNAAGGILVDSSGSGTLSVTDQNLQGLVWVDFNNDGNVDFGEQGIDGVTITLSGIDNAGHAVSQTTQTASGGIYTFNHISPGIYSLTESGVPSIYIEGKDSVGSLGGNASVQDVFSNINVPANALGVGYNFGEQPAPGSGITKGQSAGIGFWANKNGQALIAKFTGTSTDPNFNGLPSLSSWLAETMPNTFGANAGANNLRGLTPQQVAAIFLDRFAATDKLDAQIMATALNVYATNQSLVGAAASYAASYGLTVTQYGLGGSSWNIGSDGGAFNVSNNSTLTVLQILQDWDKQANKSSSTLRKLALDTFGGINGKGGV